MTTPAVPPYVRGQPRLNVFVCPRCGDGHVVATASAYRHKGHGPGKCNPGPKLNAADERAAFTALIQAAPERGH